MQRVHLRMHRAVAVVPGTTHLVPLVAPTAHTNETMASPSAQRTVFSGPVTMRKPGTGPAGPGGPAGPCGPAGPAGPCGPGVGWPHPATASVVMMAEMLNSCRIGRCNGFTCACTGRWLWRPGRRIWFHWSRRPHTPTKPWPHRPRSERCFPDRSPCANPARAQQGPEAQRVLADRQDPLGLVAPVWVGRIPRQRVS